MVSQSDSACEKYCNCHNERWEIQCIWESSGGRSKAEHALVRMGIRAQDAEDAVASAIVIAAKKYLLPGKVEDQDAYASLIYKIAKNKVWEQFRTVGDVVDFSDLSSPEGNEGNDEIEPFDLEIDENDRPVEDDVEQQELLKFAFNAYLDVSRYLTPNELAAFELRYDFDVEYAHIAIILNIKESNARKLVQRAKEKLRALMPEPL